MHHAVTRSPAMAGRQAKPALDPWRCSQPSTKRRAAVRDAGPSPARKCLSQPKPCSCAAHRAPGAFKAEMPAQHGLGLFGRADFLCLGPENQRVRNLARCGKSAGDLAVPRITGTGPETGGNRQGGSGVVAGHLLGLLVRRVLMPDRTTESGRNCHARSPDAGNRVFPPRRPAAIPAA